MRRKELVRSLKHAFAKVGGMQGLKNRYRPFVCPLAEILEQVPRGARLFDVGCGSGSLLWLAKAFRQVERADGFDVSPLAVEASRGLSGVTVTLRDRHEGLPSFAGYQVVTLVDVLHHIPPDQQQRFLVDLVGRMDSGSQLMIADIDADRKIGAFCNQLHDLLLAREWVHPWSPQRVRQVLRTAGCREVHFSRHSSLWYHHYLMRVVKA